MSGTSSLGTFSKVNNRNALYHQSQIKPTKSNLPSKHHSTIQFTNNFLGNSNPLKIQLNQTSNSFKHHFNPIHASKQIQVYLLPKINY